MLFSIPVGCVMAESGHLDLYLLPHKNAFIVQLPLNHCMLVGEYWKLKFKFFFHYCLLSPLFIDAAVFSLQEAELSS